MTITSPEKTGVTPVIDPRTALIASLRSLANLLEDIPEFPLMRSKQFHWGVKGADEVAVPQIEDLRTALTDEGVAHTVEDRPEHGIAVEIPLVGGYKVRVVHVYDRSMADYAARSSYSSVVQLDAEQDGTAA